MTPPGSGVTIGASRRGAALVFTRSECVEISLKATSNLAEFIPDAGTISVEENARVEDVLTSLGIDSDLVMLIVVDGALQAVPVGRCLFQ